MPALAPGHTLVPVLGGVVYEYIEDPKIHKGNRIFPLVRSSLKDGKVPVSPLEFHTELPDTNRTTDGNYNEIQGRIETLSFDTKQHGIQERVPQEDSSYWGRFFDPVAMAARRTGGVIGRRLEKIRADAAIDTSTFTATNAAVLWATSATCTPLVDVTTELEALEDNCGAVPEEDVIMAMTKSSLRALQRSAEIADRIKYTHPGMQTPYTKELLAEYFGVREIVILGGRYNSADQGVTPVLADIWNDDYVWIGISKEVSDDLDQDEIPPAAGYSFLWSEEMAEGDMEDGGHPIQTTIFTDNNRESEIVRSKTWIGVKVANASAARLLRVKGF